MTAFSPFEPATLMTNVTTVVQTHTTTKECLQRISDSGLKQIPEFGGLTHTEERTEMVK